MNEMQATEAHDYAVVVYLNGTTIIGAWMNCECRLDGVWINYNNFHFAFLRLFVRTPSGIGAWGHRVPFRHYFAEQRAGRGALPPLGANNECE